MKPYLKSKTASKIEILNDFFSIGWTMMSTETRASTEYNV